MNKKIGILVLFIGITAILFAGFVPNNPKTSPDPAEAIEELKNQVAGLSARVSDLEKQMKKLKDPKGDSKLNFVPDK